MSYRSEFVVSLDELRSLIQCIEAHQETDDAGYIQIGIETDVDLGSNVTLTTKHLSDDGFYSTATFIYDEAATNGTGDGLFYL